MNQERMTSFKDIRLTTFLKLLSVGLYLQFSNPKKTNLRSKNIILQNET
jgi:hypothetical protein